MHVVVPFPCRVFTRYFERTIDGIVQDGDGMRHGYQGLFHMHSVRMIDVCKPHQLLGYIKKKTLLHLYYYYYYYSRACYYFDDRCRIDCRPEYQN